MKLFFGITLVFGGMLCAAVITNNGPPGAWWVSVVAAMIGLAITISGAYVALD